MNLSKAYVIGMDFGTDSVRAVVVDAASGASVGSGVCPYPRWADGSFCDPRTNRFRQHPLDHIEGMEKAVRSAIAEAGAEVASRVVGLTVDTTGSTPCFADEEGSPLALNESFSEDPDAMFVLWKDHSAVHEAEQINRLVREWREGDYTAFEGGVYSSEWFWSKALHVIQANERVASAARTMVEQADWIPALLTGCRDYRRIKRNRCAAGHKLMWHASWGGYPPSAFFERLDRRLVPLAASLGVETWTSDVVAGALTPEWAARFGLPPSVVVSVGIYDAPAGAVSGGIVPGTMVKIMGTSTCDMLIGPKPSGKERLVRGICGQVDGSIIPGFIGYEAGQSAFGDLFAWFQRLLAWPRRVDDIRGSSTLVDLEAAAAGLEPAAFGLVAVDWFNGRRTPDANQALTGGLTGLSLGSDAPMIYRALIESAAFGSRAIIDRLVEEGVPVERITAVGGVARKSALAMQVCADVMGFEIGVSASDQSCAIGAAMYASVAAGIHPDLPAAQKAMDPGLERVYRPDAARHETYSRLYKKYLDFGAFIEAETKSTAATRS
jgi:L-ribulokinase